MAMQIVPKILETVIKLDVRFGMDLGGAPSAILR